MTAEPVAAAALPTPAPPPAPSRFSSVRAFLIAIGVPAMEAGTWLVRVVAFATGIAVQALRRSTWRRTVRAEFGRALKHSVLGALPATCVMAALVGLGLVYQALYWFEIAGQIALLGRIMVTVLVRELGPVLVALVIIGQGGTATLIHLTAMRRGGQLRLLDSQGIDPFLLLVLPRTLAYTIACFTLTMLFIATTLLAGYLTASLLGVVQVTFWGFLDTTLRAMSRTDFVLVPLKSLALGFTVGVVTCFTAFGSTRETTRVVAAGFVRSALAALAVSGLLSLIL